LDAPEGGTISAMPDMLAALIAFVGEHRRCGDLDGGLERGVIWLGCSCGARLARLAGQQRAQRVGPPLQSKDTISTQ